MTEQRQWQKQADQAIRDGTAGRALRRLYGIEDDPLEKRLPTTDSSEDSKPFADHGN